ncbi:hypothetical protein CSC62_06740 [Pseudoxanthomonas jiangsuensis]|uniref:hypothetical protein n=1 Tax=Pseudoxanthomonas jiangsuensis TaxID=619688 RepID=UPI0014785C4F|nr:hypothetical protein [Pseudoxanthomonas jiangsuensis]KAF1698142.1 hypothetical protein CSC62_06740 [Pseudoxanthomonas jiangsuensis]
MTTFDPHAANDCASDASLLEGLYQLVVSGHTDSWEFEQLTNEVYERLMSTYSVAA